MDHAGFVEPGGTLVWELNFEDGAGNPADVAGASVSIFPTGDDSSAANPPTVTLAKVGSRTGDYKLLITGGNLAAGRYVARCTAGTVGSPAMSLANRGLVVFDVNAAGVAPAILIGDQVGADGKVLLSSDAQDLHSTFLVGLSGVSF